MVKAARADFLELEQWIQEVSSHSRLIPTHFGRRRGGPRPGKLTINLYNQRELFGKLYGSKYFQHFKIECPDETTAAVTYERLQEVLE